MKEENAQALNLLAEVVDKLQGLIVASKQPDVSPECRRKQPPPQPPPRVSSISPKVVVRKTPTPYPRRFSSSSSCSTSSSSSSCADGFAKSRNSRGTNGERTVTFGAAQGSRGRNGHLVCRATLDDQQECETTGCLTTKKKRKNK